MRQRASGRARDRIRQARRAALWNDHAMRTSGQRRANDSAEIVRVFHSIEDDYQRELTPFRRQKVIEISVLLSRCDGDDTLMRGHVRYPEKMFVDEAVFSRKQQYEG